MFVTVASCGGSLGGRPRCCCCCCCCGYHVGVTRDWIGLFAVNVVVLLVVRRAGGWHDAWNFLPEAVDHQEGRKIGRLVCFWHGFVDCDSNVRKEGSKQAVPPATQGGERGGTKESKEAQSARQTRKNSTSDKKASNFSDQEKFRQGHWHYRVDGQTHHDVTKATMRFGSFSFSSRSLSNDRSNTLSPWMNEQTNEQTNDLGSVGRSSSASNLPSFSDQRAVCSIEAMALAV